MRTEQFLHVRDQRSAFILLGILAVIWYGVYNNLQPLADWITWTLLRLDPSTPFGQALNFFFYDVPKILLLLAGMIFLITLLQTYIDTQRVRDIVNKYGRSGVGNFMAAVLGAVTPFCSCSSIPLFIGFVQAGIPLGITMSFLIASPLISEVAFVMLIGTFGWKIAFLYLASGMLIGVVAGLLLGRMNLERYVEPFVFQIKSQGGQTAFVETKLTWNERLARAADATRDIIRRVWIFVIIGIGLGALIHGFVPEDLMTNIMGKDAWWSVPAAVLIGIPLYANPAGIVPVGSALLSKGAALGTVLAFMMAVIALSLPEMIILRKVLKPPLIAIFVGVVALAIIITGYLFNFIV